MERQNLPGKRLVGIGAFYAIALLPFLGPLRNTIVILMVVFVMRYIPSGYGAIAPILLQVGKDLDRASRTVGASSASISATHSGKTSSGYSRHFTLVRVRNCSSGAQANPLLTGHQRRPRVTPWARAHRW